MTETMAPVAARTRSSNRTPDEPYLDPIEDPSDPTLRQVFGMMRSNFGRVITPVKVHSARLPPAFLQWYTRAGELDRELQLPAETALLVRQQVARINVCEFCVDASRAATIMASMDQAKFDALDRYASSPLFSAAERALLDYVTELTREKKVQPATFAKLAEHYSEREICEVVYLVASEHVVNMTNLGLNVKSDLLCDLVKRRKSASG